MRKWRMIRWVISSATLFALGGCVTNQQYVDFTRTELARVIADLVGRWVGIVGQATV